MPEKFLIYTTKVALATTIPLTWSPALADLETALAFAFPESLPALPPA